MKLQVEAKYHRTRLEIWDLWNIKTSMPELFDEFRLDERELKDILQLDQLNRDRVYAFDVTIDNVHESLP